MELSDRQRLNVGTLLLGDDIFVLDSQPINHAALESCFKSMPLKIMTEKSASNLDKEVTFLGVQVKTLNADVNIKANDK